MVLQNYSPATSSNRRTSFADSVMMEEEYTATHAMPNRITSKYAVRPAGNADPLEDAGGFDISGKW